VTSRARAIALAISLASPGVVLAACSSGGATGTTPSSTAGTTARPRTDATLAIVRPANGTVVHGTTMELRLRLEGARIVRATSQDLRPDEGHVHVILDGKLVSMNYRLGNELTGLSAGRHLLQAEFVAADHAPFDPRVIAVTSFVVKPSPEP
jgi:hypothetical protein